MKLKSMKIRNFRGYDEETVIEFDDITALVGKNDAGKSTILEALEIFFNNKMIVCERDDLSVTHKQNDEEFEITCIFDEFKNKVTIDAASETDLRSENLLNEKGLLEIKKVFKCTVAKPKPTTYIVCNHPSEKLYSDLLILKIKDLKERAENLDIDPHRYDARNCASIRNAIRESKVNLSLEMIDLPVDKEDAKKIYTQIETFLPVYALFQSDRASSDSDREITDPMQIAVQKALKELEDEINTIKNEVKQKAIDTANKTLEKLKEMDSQLADSLVPEFKSEPKFDSLFKLSIISDNNIPMNKRGSGVRRLLLLNFFRAEAERRLSEDNRNSSIIYAFEEPETSQHPNHQKMLVNAFLELSKKDNNQVIITTHTPALCGLLPVDSLRLIDNTSKDKICSGTEEVYIQIANMLGIIPEINSNNAKGILLVEGKDDILFFKHILKLLKEEKIIVEDFDDLGIVIAFTGGCDNLKGWITEHIVQKFNIPWAIFLDSDRKKDNEETKNTKLIEKYISKGIPAFVTKKREVENYLHPSLFLEEYEFNDYDDVKNIIESKVFSKNWKKMTYNLFNERQLYEDSKGNKKYEITDIILNIIEMIK